MIEKIIFSFVYLHKTARDNAAPNDKKPKENGSLAF